MNVVVVLFVLASALVPAFADEEEIRTPVSLIVNGVNATSNRYPYFVSLRYRNTNSTAEFRHYCGGSLISDRLVLTAAHCVLADDFLPNLGSARASTFAQLGLDFNFFQNTYIVESTTLQLSAFVGVESRVAGQGILVNVWFTHPWFDPTNSHYDIAVGLLSEPAAQTPVKLLSFPADVYTALEPTLNFTAIGVGKVITDNYNLIQMGLDETAPDRNNETLIRLEEVNIGTMVPRGLCGKALTASQQRNASDGSGNTAYGTLATVIDYGRMCIGVATNAELDERLRQTAVSIASVAQARLPYSTQADLLYSGVDYTDPEDIFAELDGYNDTCQGDSGGPVLIKGGTSSDDVQVAITSAGYGCGSGLPAVYHSVQNYLNDTVFDSFLLDVLTAVPAFGNSVSNLVTEIPTPLPSAG